MVVYPSEDRTRQRRVKAEQAISLAMKNRWDEAVQVNREILELFPDDVDSFNRLGKALMELGRYAEARDAYNEAVKRDPMNGIAAKNLQRLTKLAEEGAAAPPPSPVDPRLFIEESGKTAVTQLTEVRATDAVAKLTAGDQLNLDVRGNKIVVVNLAGEEIGRIEPKLEQNLVRLFGMGNQYAVFVTAASDANVIVIIRETHRTPAMGNRPSFRPTAAAEGGFRAYTREGAVRYDFEDEEEEEELLEEEEEAEAGAAPVDAEAVEETPIDAIVEAEDEEPEEQE